jgi:hypothetical protein
MTISTAWNVGPFYANGLITLKMVYDLLSLPVPFPRKKSDKATPKS